MTYFTEHTEALRYTGHMIARGGAVAMLVYLAYCWLSAWVDRKRWPFQ